MQDVTALASALRVELLRNLAGMGNPALYNYCRSSTKLLIREYVDEVILSLEAILHSPTEHMDLLTKYDFFARTRHAFGRTALLLSGGAAMGMYHLGVIKVLSEEGLLPRIISGSSVGALVR